MRGPKERKMTTRYRKFQEPVQFQVIPHDALSIRHVILIVDGNPIDLVSGEAYRLGLHLIEASGAER